MLLKSSFKCGGKKTAWCRFNVDKLPKLARLQAALSNTEDMIMFRPRKSINFDWTRLSYFSPFFTPLSCRLHHFHAVWKFMQSRKLSLRTICSFKKKKSDNVAPSNPFALWRSVCLVFVCFFSNHFLLFQTPASNGLRRASFSFCLTALGSECQAGASHGGGRWCWKVPCSPQREGTIPHR